MPWKDVRALLKCAVSNSVDITMKKKIRCQYIYDQLYALYGDCSCPLKHDSPFQLLAAVMLSAQCRDERVNQVTEKLFAIAPDAPAMAALPEEQLREIIHPCGLANAKSRNLKLAAERIVKVYNNQVPSNMDDLITLAGIGRKSANVILGNAFGLPGFPVDTHVKRLLNRIGVVNSDSPEYIEKIITPQISPELWCNFSHLLITHGRNICPARKPRCPECPLQSICKFAENNLP